MAVRNTMADLNNHQFEQLERLNDESVTGEQLEREIDRGKSMAEVAKAILASANLALQARKYMDTAGEYGSVEIPLLGVKGKD